MRIMRNGDVLTVEPVFDAAAEKQKVIDLVAALCAIGQPADGAQVCEPIDFPDRPGL